MLPSSGYFRSAVCPFFKSGLCERPGCHFKHTRPDLKGHNKSWPSNEVNDFTVEKKPDLFDLLSSEGTNFECPPVEPVGIPAYNPTPVEKLNPTPGILKVTSIKKEIPSPYVPEYTPTPLSQLKPVFLDPEVTFLQSVPPRKRKKNVEEYIPEEVRCPSRKRVSFNLPEESVKEEIVLVESDDIVLVESSDEDVPPESIPVFSDDDLDEETTDKIVQIKSEPTGEKTTPTTEPVEEKKVVDKYSLVDKILVDVTKNEQFIRGFKKPPNVTAVLNVKKEVVGVPSDKKCSSSVIAKKNGVVVDKVAVDKVVVKSENPKSKINSKISEKKDGSSSKTSDAERKSEKSSSSKTSSHKSSSDKKEKYTNDKKSSSSSSSKSKIEDKKPSSHNSHSKSSSQKTSNGPKDGSKSHSSKPSDKDKIRHSHSKETKEKTKSEVSKTEKVDTHSSKKRPSESSSKLKNLEPDAKKLKLSKKEPESSATKKDSTKIQDEKVSSSSIIAKENKTVDYKSSHGKSEIKNSKSSHSKIEKVAKANGKSNSVVIPAKEIKVSPKTKLSSSPTKHSKSSTSHAPVDENSDSSEGCLSDPDESVLSSADSDDVDEECWRIFNESENATQEASKSPDPEEEIPSSVPSESPGLLIFRKKRFAHQTSFQRQEPTTAASTKILNPAQVMHNRYLKLQEIYAKQNEKKESNPFASSSNSNADGQKKRIAAVPNPNLVNACVQKNKLLLSPTHNSTALNPTSQNATQRVATSLKLNARIAHIPTVATKPRPIIPSGYGNKVASNIRQQYLNSFIDECLKFCTTEDQAYEMALEEEKLAYERCSSRTVYLNVAANALNRLRHRAREGPLSDSDTSPTVSSTTPSSEKSRRRMSHETILIGARAQKLSYSIEKKKYKSPDVVIKGIALYKALQEYCLTEKQLVEHGFPMPHPAEPSRAVIAGIYSKPRPNVSSDSSKRICSRCQKTYYVNVDDEYVKEEECDFHWGRLLKRRIAGQIEAMYTCCSSDSASEGCCVGPGHVFEGFDSHLLKGFVRTLPKTPPPDGYYGVYSLDCEMCYTSAGTELTRVTVISPEMKPIFETYVKPEHKVLDYNTRFSGIKEEDLVGITTSIRDVQAIMLLMFNDKTILIGHSLESDLKALKLIHKTVVDTSVVFPHKRGLPYKRALRTLMAEQCNKIIQNGTEGHDSQEDAAACMELMLLKLKEDAKCPR